MILKSKKADYYTEAATHIMSAMEEALGLVLNRGKDGSESIAAIAALLRLYFIERKEKLRRVQ